MLHQNKISSEKPSEKKSEPNTKSSDSHIEDLNAQCDNKETNLSENHTTEDDSSELIQLRALLLGTEYQELLQLQKEFSDHSHASEKISQVISEAIAIRSKQDNSISNVLVPSLEGAIRASAKRNPKRLANALFPVIGPAIREAVADTFSALIQQVNYLLENSLSARSIKWRINAFRTKRSFAEVMLSETFVYQVEQVFLIHRETSLLINHLTSEHAIVKDPDMVSGMLSAVTDFVKDSFVVDPQHSVKSIKFGQLNLLFEVGPYAVIVAAVRGMIPSNLQIRLREQIEELHRLYGNRLERYDGIAERFPDTYEQLEKCLLSKKKNEVEGDVDKKKVPWFAIFILSLVLLISIAWWISRSAEQHKWSQIVHQLQAESGLVVLEHYKENGEYVINGLRDPLAKNPADIIASAKDFNKPVKLQMQSYYSNESEIVKRRIQDILQLPATVSASLDNGVLHLRGQADSSWVSGLSEKLPFIWGINRIDTSQLSELEDIQQKIMQLIGSIEGVVIEFASNSSQLLTNDLLSILSVRDDVKALQTYATKVGQTLKLGILGFADASGTLSTNNEISEQRAREVHDQLVELGMSEDDLLAKGLGNYANQTELNQTLQCISQRCVVFEVYIH